MSDTAIQMRPSLFFVLATAALAWPGPSTGALPETGRIEQHSEGACSPPIVNNEGHVSISCPGIAPDALLYLENHLSEQFGRLSDQLRNLSDTQRTINNLNDIIDDLHKQADGWAQRYRELSSRLAEKESNNAQFSQAHELIERGNFSEAEHILSEIGSKQEDDIAKFADVQYSLGELAMLRFDSSTALSHYKRAYQLENNNYLYAFHYGSLANSERDYDNAEAALYQALQASEGFPPNTTPRINRASVLEVISILYVYTHRSSLAESVTSQIISLCKSTNDGDIDYLPCFQLLISADVGLGLIYKNRGQLKDAETSLLSADLRPATFCLNLLL